MPVPDTPVPASVGPETAWAAMREAQRDTDVARILDQHLAGLLAATQVRGVVRRLCVSLRPYLAVPAPAPPSGSHSLTERELSVLLLIADGATNPEIAVRLFVTVDTVKTHIRRIFQKLGARDRAQAVALAYRAGVLGGRPS